MTPIEPTQAAGWLAGAQQFVSAAKLHPILVNFTAALVPFSVAADAAARWRKDETLRHTAWWALLAAVLITPLTAVAGWLFWMPDDKGAAGMAVHKWLGTGLAFLLPGLLAWRWRFHRRQSWASIAYLAAGALLVAALVVQGHLGGEQTFSGM